MMKTYIKKMVCSLTVAIAVTQTLYAEGSNIMDVQIFSYEEFMQDDDLIKARLKRALHEQGIVGIRGIPGYREKVERFTEAARGFSALPKEVREKYAPNRENGDTFLGYEQGKEKFQLTDGTWVIDSLKESYYAHVPDDSNNKWPFEINLQTPYQEIGLLMSEMGEQVMRKVGVLGEMSQICVDEEPRISRMLHYAKSSGENSDNPLWCGAHYDHGLFTALLPATYFKNGVQISEPEEAGLFVRSPNDTEFKKVIADDLDVMMFQVGEFAQLATDDGIRATEHRVHKAGDDEVERFTMALFFNPQMENTIYSTSVLTQDARYGAMAGQACTYRQWDRASFERYLVK